MANPVQELINRVFKTTMAALPMAKLYHSFNPQSKEDYQSVIDNHLKTNTRTSLEQIAEQCFSLKSSFPELASFTREQMSHAVIDTMVYEKFGGFRREEKAQNALKKIFPSMNVLYNEEWDEKYAVDFVLCSKDKKDLFFAIQVKSKSTKHIENSSKLERDAKIKHFNFKLDFHVPVAFLYYGKYHFENLPQVISKIHKRAVKKHFFYDKFNPDLQSGIKDE